MRNQTWKTLATAALIAPALLIGGCKSDGEGDKVSMDDTKITEIVLADPVSILDKKAGNSKALGFDVQLIKTKAEYDKLGDKDIFAGVDFEKNDLVIASLGERPTGGYAIDITSLQVQGKTLYVIGKATVPGKDAVTTQALTYPYVAVVIANTGATKVQPAID